MMALDTNLLVRLLTNDEPRQAARVQTWLETQASSEQPAYVDHVVLCELAWVLERSYGYPRNDVREALAALLEQPVLHVESPDMVQRALLLYGKGPADFSDYLLALRARAAGFGPVLTLDRRAARGETHRMLP